MIAQPRKFWSLNITAEKEKTNKFENHFYFCLFAWSSFFKKSYLTQEKTKLKSGWERKQLGVREASGRPPQHSSVHLQKVLLVLIYQSVFPTIPRPPHSLTSLIQHTQPAQRMQNYAGWSKDRGTLLAMPEFCSQRIAVSLNRMCVCVRVCIFLLWLILLWSWSFLLFVLSFWFWFCYDFN